MGDRHYIHFTHMDLDAAGCAVVLDVCSRFGGPKYDHRFCKNPDDCSQQIAKFLDEEMKDGEVYEILISDISIKDEAIADRLNEEYESGNVYYLRLYDHHPTALWMADKYTWCTIKRWTESKVIDNHLTCGSEMLYNFNNGGLKLDPLTDVVLGKYIEFVRLYDTYDWKQCNCKIAYDHNTIFNKYGMAKYIEKMVERIIARDDVGRFDAEEQEIIKAEDDAFNAYLDECRKRLTRSFVYRDKDYEDFTYGSLFCSKYSSEIGNRLSNENPELAFILMINVERQKVEIRTAREDFDTSIFAKRNGGGGHPKASGFPLTNEMLSNLAGCLYTV